MTISEQILPQFMLRIYEFLATPIIKTWIWDLIIGMLGAGIMCLILKSKKK